MPLRLIFASDAKWHMARVSGTPGSRETSHSRAVPNGGGVDAGHPGGPGAVRETQEKAQPGGTAGGLCRLHVGLVGEGDARAG